MSEEDLFLEEMAGVAPLKRGPRARLTRDTKSGDGAARRAAAVGDTTVMNPLVDEGIEPLDAWYVLEFKRPGVQHGVYRKLRMGRYQIEARLDLHRMTVKQAREEVFQFIADALNYGLRTLLITHGKGQRKPDQERSAVLKAYVNQWLQDLEAVQAFHSAQPPHGGTGAVYVLLKKSADKKRENRERFMKGRVQLDN